MNLIEQANRLKERVQQLNCRVVEAGLTGHQVLSNGGVHIGTTADELRAITAGLNELIGDLVAAGASARVALSPQRDLAQVILRIPQSLLAGEALPPRVHVDDYCAIWDSGPVSNPTTQGVGF